MSMSKDNHDQLRMRDTSPEVPRSRGAIAGQSLSLPRASGKIRKFLHKFSAKSSKNSRSRDAVPRNVDLTRASDIEVQVPLPGMEEGLDLQSVNAAIQAAREVVVSVRTLSGPARTVATAAQNAHADLDIADDLHVAYLQPFRIFDSVVEKIADIHPYAKLALGVLSCASKMILAQVDRDDAVHRLLAKLAQVYDFMTQDEILFHISSMRDIIGQISRQTLECARFMSNYSEIKNFWKRVGKDVISETDNIIQRYIDVLDELMQQLRGSAAQDANTLIPSPEFAPEFTTSYTSSFEIFDLKGMPYAMGAGLDTRKLCLRGTRTEILSQITEWINASGDDVPCVLWLSGSAGTGKSAIAHTITSWFNDVGGLVSCFCFDQNRQADRRHEKIFSTIALDLADRVPEMRRALVVAVRGTRSLKYTGDIVQQWHKLLMEPLMKLSRSNVGPVLIVIDALDDSGGVEIRRGLIRILTGRLLAGPPIPPITALPNNIRFIVTSRPLRDIDEEFSGAQHILQMSVNDIPLAVAGRDICAYVSAELEGLSGFGSKEVAALAGKADGLFEWARRACAFIKDSHMSSPLDSFNAVMTNDREQGCGLLYPMYSCVLGEVFHRPTDAIRTAALAKFRSVMGQIFGTTEPLPLASLNAMRQHFPDDGDHYDVGIVIKSMGSLLSGTTDPCTPIRPLHASFREFLTDSESSGEFFVDMSKVQRNLAFSSLRVMEVNLRFNICDLKSSYLPNREDPQLPERVEKCIPPHLAYASRFWAAHVDNTHPDTELAQEIKSFFDHERLVFWIEVLGLLNALASGTTAMALTINWLKFHFGYEEVSSTATDVQIFIQTFGSIILHSTPHLYVSALPFSPINSAISRKFAAVFPNTLRVAHGRNLDLTVVQSVLGGHVTGVLAVSFSPDRTRIVTGLADKTVRLWDAATGQPLGEPLQGHTGAVSSVSFSPDGLRIVSGSYDKTVRLWDAHTGQPLGEPFRGHTRSVTSVSFAPDGTRIATGSCDTTVWLWDATTGRPVGEPLRGHTARVNSVSFSSDGTRIVSGSSDNTIQMWDVATGQPCGEPLRGHTAWVNSVSFSPDGTRIASGSDDKTIRLWNTATGHPVGEPLQGHTGLVSSVTFSPDGTRIVSGSYDKTVRLWNTATGQSSGESLQGHSAWVNSVSFSSDGTRIVSGSADATVRLWYAEIGQPLHEQECAERDCSMFSLDKNPTTHPTEVSTIVSTNTSNKRRICFSPNSNHALRNAVELVEGTSHEDRWTTPFLLGVDGWMIGPGHRLLFWVPHASQPMLYTPGTALVIPRGSAELDLSRMAHGQHWSRCRGG